MSYQKLLFPLKENLVYDAGETFLAIALFLFYVMASVSAMTAWDII